MQGSFTRRGLIVLGFIVIILLMFKWLLNNGQKNVLNDLPIYDTATIRFSLNQINQLEKVLPAYAPTLEDIRLIQSITQFWKNTNLKIDSLLHLSIDRENLDARLFVVKCLNDRNNEDAWLKFIPKSIKDSNRIADTYFWHYPRANDISYYFYQKKGKLFFSTDRRYLERVFVINQNKKTNIPRLLKKQGITIPKDTEDIELLVGPKYQSPNTIKDQFTYLSLKETGETISLKGQESIIQFPFEEAIFKDPPQDMSGIFSIVPEQVNFMDVISLPSDKRIGEPEPLSFWSDGIIQGVGSFGAYIEEGNANFVVLPIKNTELLSKSLDDLFQQQGMLHQELYQTYSIKQLVNENLVKSIWPEGYREIRNPYLAVLGDYLILGAQLERLRLWVAYFLNQNNLLNSSKWQAMLSTLSPQQTRIILWDGFDQSFPEQQIWWHQFQASYPTGLIEWQKEGSKTVFSGNIGGENTQLQFPAITAQQRFDQPIIAGPFVFRTKKDKLFYTIQTSDKVLHTYGPTGNRLWEYQAQTILKQGIQTVKWNSIDWRLLFADGQKVIFLDEEGILIEKWFLEVPSNGHISIVNFEEPGDPHFFIPTVNGTVYAYNRLNEPFLPWNPLEVGFIEGNIQHWATADEDYLVWKNKDKDLMIYDRGGALFKTVKEIEEFYVDRENNNLLTLNVDGQDLGIMQDNQDNKVVQVPLAVKKAYWGSDFLNISDGRRIALIELDNIGQFQVINLARKVENIEQIFPLGKGEEQSYVLKDASKNQLWLFNQEGQLLFNEPIPAQSATTIGKTLITISNKESRLYTW